MSWEQLFPGCDVRFEGNDRPFEISGSPEVARDPETPARIVHLLLRRGWRVTLGPFYSETCRFFADVRTCEPAHLPTSRIPS